MRATSRIHRQHMTMTHIATKKLMIGKIMSFLSITHHRFSAITGHARLFSAKASMPPGGEVVNTPL